MLYWLFNKILFWICIISGLILLIFSYELDITDRISYLNSLENYPIFLSTRINSTGLLFSLFNDPLWVLLLGMGYFSKLDPEIYIITICCIAYIISIKKIYNSTKHFYKLVPIILSAGFLVNFMTHIRQGVALTLLIYSIYLEVKPRIKKPFFYWITPLIHNSFLFVTIFFYFEEFIKGSRGISKSKLILFAGAFFAIGLLFLSFGRQTYFHDSIEATHSLGFGWLYWMVIFLLIQIYNLSKSKLELSKESFFILFYLVLYPIIPTVAGRLMEVFLIFIFFWLQTQFKTKLYLLITIAYFILSWVSRYDSNYLGFGA